MAGYTRNNSNITTGNVIRAEDINGEYDDLVTAFNAVSGHTHDGTSAEGAPITKVGPAQNISVTATAVVPSIHDQMDIGTTTLRFAKGYFQGDVATEGAFVGDVTGNVTGDVTGDVTGNLTGDVTGNVTGDLTGDVTGNLTGDVTGDVTGNLTGNAGTATALETARNIAGQSFDGTANINIAPTDLTDVTATASEINILDGATLTTAELNILDGVTSTTAELNLLDGATVTTDELNILDGVTATTTELNILDGVTATTAELNLVDGVTASTSELNILDGVLASASEINILNGATLDTAELNLLDGVTATTAELNYVDGVTSNIQTQLDAKQATLTSTSNGYGTRTVSTSDPSGGVNGDIWYKVES